jgi:hypothetical protein
MLKHILDYTRIPREHTKEEIQHMWEFKLYAFSSFTCVIAGIIRIKQGAKQDGINLIFQSFLSYMSDVHTMGIPSRWHIIDRYFAIIISAYHFYSLKSRKSIIVNLFLFMFGFIFLRRSQIFSEQRDIRYLLEHTKWHCILPIMALTSD